MSDKTSAEKILENIFTIMQKLYSEMKINTDEQNGHLHVFELFAELGKTLADADRASFWRWDKRNHKLLTTAATGTSSQIVIDDTSGLVGRAISENRMIVTNDPYNHPDFNAEVDKQTGYVTKSVLVLPVANFRGEIIGAFQVINKLGDAGFDADNDAKRLSIAAFICGMALESDIFLADSQHDKLTELKNRLGLQNDFQTRYEKILRDGTPLAMIMCDIDFFKHVNDSFGHNAGDAVLKHVAEILSSALRENDGAYRWGGEEFILILDDMTVDDAEKVAERIRQTIMDSVCNFEDKKIRMTMSFGVSEISAALSIEDNVKIADDRLYRAKETGRNKVIAD
ncbi:MAG: sensor domain-containing diguanylate cyclase [Selenomonadaceae bacterium]|nr:sensor domain-containing diguanylate cyclase [Selenomonadaceae bacterium]